MTRTHRLLLFAAASCHLGLAVLGALDVCPWDLGPPGRFLVRYGALSGADSSYGFYAPGVATPLRVDMTIVDRQGDTLLDTLPTGVTREADLRVEDLVDSFERKSVDDVMKREVATSWAAAMFRRHPEAEVVTLDVGRVRMPSMAQTREGARPRWKSLFRARIARTSDPHGGTP